MEIRIYFHLLCNYLQTNPSSTDPSTHPTAPTLKKSHSRTLSYQTVELFQLARNTAITTTDIAGNW